MSIRTRPMRAEEAEVAILQALFEANELPKRLDTLRWRFLSNPTKQVLVELAVDDDEDACAGVYCVSPVRFKLGAREALGVQSIDTLTDSRYRGRGLFRKLATVCYQSAADADAELVYGFPNGHSAHGFFERLGWTNLDPVPFLIRPLRLGYVARRLGLPEALASKVPSAPLASTRPPRLPIGRELRVVLEFDEAFDRLWQRFREDVPVAVVRDAAYLRWRVSSHPEFRYKTIGLYERGELRGFVTFSVVDKHGGRVGYVLEMMHDPGAHDVGRSLLARAISNMAALGADVALAWNLGHSPNHRAYRRSGFVPFPERVRPIELHFGARVLRADQPDGLIGNRRSWYLSYCDSDTV